MKPGDVGAYHTDAFETLGEKYKSKKPQTQFDVVKDLADILAGYCPLEDAECVSNAYKTTKEEFQRSSRGIIREIIYPDNFDPKMKELVESIETSIKEINELSLDDVLYSLESIRESLEDMTGVNEDHLSASLAGLSVAMESTKLWHSTYYDNEHPLHFMIDYFSGDDNERRLDEAPPLFFDPLIIFADYTAAMAIGFGEIQAAMQTPVTLFTTVNPAIMASAAAFMQTGTVLPVIPTNPNTGDDFFVDDFFGGMDGGDDETGTEANESTDDNWAFCFFPVPPIVSTFLCD